MQMDEQAEWLEGQRQQIIMVAKRCWKRRKNYFGSDGGGGIRPINRVIVDGWVKN